MQNCPGANLESRIKNLESLCLVSMTLLNATIAILKKYDVLDESELKDKVDELYGNIELSLLEPLNKTIH